MRHVYNIYVPVDPTSQSLGLLRGSAIVGLPEDGRILIDFEGDAYGAVNLRTYAGRLTCALDRRVTMYPTKARMSVATADLMPVGTAVFVSGIGGLISDIYLPEVL